LGNITKTHYANEQKNKQQQLKVESERKKRWETEDSRTED